MSAKREKLSSTILRLGEVRAGHSRSQYLDAAQIKLHQYPTAEQIAILNYLPL